jgi:hypothetical protein
MGDAGCWMLDAGQESKIEDRKLRIADSCVSALKSRFGVGWLDRINRIEHNAFREFGS